MREQRDLTDANVAARLNKTLIVLVDQVELLAAKVDGLQTKIDEMKELNEAWAAVKTSGKFFRWIAGVASGLAGAWLIAKAIGREMLQ